MTRSCFVCTAEELVDGHHIIPVEYGGARDGRCVDLCPRCHRLVHRNGEHLYKTGKLLKTYHALKPREQAQALILINYIKRAKLEFEDNGEEAKEARNMVGISCTKEELLVFHSVKAQMGFTSLPRAIKALVFKEYKQQMGMKHDSEAARPDRNAPAQTKGRRDKRKVRDKGRKSSHRYDR